MIDAEETWIQIAIDTIAHRMMQFYNKENVTVLNTYQMYRKNAVAALQNDFEKAVAGGYKFGVKIVRGAYMEKEREEATKHGYDSPILSCNLSKFGYNVCKYLPFGPVKDVIPYLTRRARENSSINGFTSQELQTIIAEIQRRSIAIT